MAWSSFFRRTAAPGEAPVAPPEPIDAVTPARVRARRRLIGAVVLLVLGVLGFPLVFETQPRPIPVDIPIEIPRKDASPPSPLNAAAPRAVEPLPSEAATAVVPEPVAPRTDDTITESREEAGRDIDRPSLPQVPGRTAEAVEPRAASPLPSPSSSPAKISNRPSAADPKLASVPSDAARAKALLEGQPLAAASEPGVARYIVQVGAFAESAAAQDTRSKLERAGLKTYTQVASTPGGSRIRVRLGPFGTREEADRAVAKAKGAGFAAIVQVL